MKYKEIYPNDYLTHFIRYFWTYEHTMEDVEYTILPDACFDLVVDFEYGVLQHIYLTGIWTKPVKITVTKGTTLFAVRFKISAAEYLLNREIKSVLNTMTILPGDYWNIHLEKSTEFMHFTCSVSERMNAVLHEQSEIDNRKLKLFDLIYSETCQSVSQLSEKVTWSSRQINRYFSKQFGFPLKTFLNIVRCNSSYPDIVKGCLYPEKEYTDQAHFIKEIKKYTDNSPGQLYKNENDRFLQLNVFKTK